MCWLCDKYARIQWIEQTESDGLSVHVQAASLLFQTAAFEKGYDLFPADGVGHRMVAGVQDPAAIAAVGLLTEDFIPHDPSTPYSLTVDGPGFISTINEPGDQDWFRVELQAGVVYEIGLFSSTQGDSGIPLYDPYVEIFRADGTFITFDDSSGPSSPNGTDDALLTFTPVQSGTYYINARGWDIRDPVGAGIDPNPLTTTGDFVGDYEVFVRVSTEPSSAPYYYIDFESEDDPSTERNEIGLPTLDSSPLHAIDWGGNRVNKDGVTVRNPDGAEGPRPTGNPLETPDGNAQGHPGKNVITVYFAKAGEVYVDEDPTTAGTTDTIVAKGFEAWEIAVYEAAFAAYAQVADLVYVVVDGVYDPLTMKTTSDFTFITYAGTTGTSVSAGGVSQGTPSLLGRMSPPDEDNEGQSEFNANDKRWTPEGLQPGGFSFNTLIHEMGHGHGLAHPHDGGGGSSTMRGVVEEVDQFGVPKLFDYTTGDFDLNQGVHSMMSYEDGWQMSPYGQAASTDPFGWLGGLMAFDIAAIQDKYGVNEEWATGDDTYTLKDVNAPGTFFSCIWDAGGTDQIVYDGARDANIDLRAATLKYEVGGGGWMNYAWGIHGGFTIANGVTIENARTGSGNDRLTGNDAANRLDAGAGNDVLTGNGGNDVLIGGAGADEMSGGAGSDLFVIGAGESGIGLARDTILGFEQGSDQIDLSGTGATRFIGSSAFSGVAGQVRAVTFAGTTVIEVDANGDRIGDLQIELDDDLLLNLGDFVGLGDANGATNGDDVLNGSALGEVLRGYGGADVINGLGGNDILIGGAGADRLTGGTGNDLFVYESIGDSVVGSSDVITDFTRRSDRIDLSAIDANSATSANDAFSFIGKNAFSGHAGELRAFTTGSSTVIQADVNGDGVADLQITFDDKVSLTGADFVF